MIPSICVALVIFGRVCSEEVPNTRGILWKPALWGEHKDTDNDKDKDWGKNPEFWNKFVESKVEFLAEKEKEKDAKWEAIKQFFSRKKETFNFSGANHSSGSSHNDGPYPPPLSPSPHPHYPPFKPSEPVSSTPSPSPLGEYFTYPPPSKGQIVHEPPKKTSTFWDQLSTWLSEKDAGKQDHHNHGSGGHVPESGDSYWRRRNAIAEWEIEKVLGHRIVLTQLEAVANEYFMKTKLKEYDHGYRYPRTFPPALNFLEAKSSIDESHLFALLKRLPKGALLGGYVPSMVTPDFLYRLTRLPNLYFCTHEKELLFKFAKEAPSKDCHWKLLSEFRASLPDFEGKKFEELVREELSLVGRNGSYKEYWSTWRKLESITDTVAPLINYRPNFIDFFKEVLEELYRDNIRYAELSTDFPEVYELDGTTYDKATVAAMYKDCIEKFKENHRDFIGVKLIYSPGRIASIYDIREYKKTIMTLHEYFPDLILGIQLIGEEDHGTFLYEIAEELLQFPPNIKFYFSVGVTNFWGTPSDYDLLDALALKSIRLNNAFAITKHPEVIRFAADKGIAIETCAISNQILGLVDDLRNHPHANLIANDFPLVICSDRPGAWGATGVSYDWYEIFMGMSPRNADLRTLKQLALNSFIYSSLSDDEKKFAIVQWNSAWHKFIQEFVKYAV